MDGLNFLSVYAEKVFFLLFRSDVTYFSKILIGSIKFPIKQKISSCVQNPVCVLRSSTVVAAGKAAITWL